MEFNHNNPQGTPNGIPHVKKLADAAAYFGLPTYTVRSWVKSGCVPAILSGRKLYICIETLAAFLQNGNCSSAELTKPASNSSAYVPSKKHNGNKMPPIF